MPHTYEYVEGFEELQDEWHEALPNLLAGGPDRTDLMIPLSRLSDAPPPLQETYTMARVNLALADESGVGAMTLKSRRQDRPIVRTRQLGMWLMLKLCPARTTAQIGRFFGRDHTTVINARERINEELQKDAELRLLRDRVLSRLGVA